MLYITSPEIIHLALFKLCTFHLKSHFKMGTKTSMHSVPGNYHSNLCFSGFEFLRFHLQVRSWSVSLSVPGLSHLALHRPGSSMLSQIHSFLFFKRLNNIPLHVWERERSHIFFIHPSGNGHLMFLSYLGYCELWYNECGSASISLILVSFPLEMYPEVVLLDHMVDIFQFFEESLYCSPLWLNQFAFLWTVPKDSFYHILTNFLIVNILTGVR